MRITETKTIIKSKMVILSMKTIVINIKKIARGSSVDSTQQRRESVNLKISQWKP